MTHGTRICDLPAELLSVIGEHLGLTGTWRSVDEVARDQAALAMTARCMRPLAAALACDLRKALDLASNDGSSSQQCVTVCAPCVPEDLSDLEGADESWSMARLRAAAKRCCVKSERSKAGTLQRVLSVVRARPDARARQLRRLEAFQARPAPPPVPRSPIPGRLRKRVLEPQRLSAKGACARFLLTQTDLATIPAMLAQNPYFRSAAPMRLYRVSDLRDAATRRYGGIEHMDEQRERRRVRAARMLDAMHDARQRRTDALTKALRARGCELRADSRLCAAYINTGAGDVDDVANTMAEMKFCFEHTEYSAILSTLRAHARELGVRNDCDEMSIAARTYAIHRFLNGGGDTSLVPAHVLQAWQSEDA